MNNFIKGVINFIPRVMKRTAIICLIVEANGDGILQEAHCKRIKNKIRLCNSTLMFRLYKKYIRRFITPPTKSLTVGESNTWVDSIPCAMKYKPVCLMKRDVLKVLDELDLLAE